jgi:hypothetical protein
VLATESLGEGIESFFTSGRLREGFGEIPPPERQLVRRWLDWERPGAVLLRLSDFPGFPAIAAALLAQVAATAEGETPASGRQRLRAAE